MQYILEIIKCLKDFNSYSILIRMILAVLIGGIIGSERARHGRAAGMRTHILVCLGAALTSMTSMYVSDVLGNSGDVFRISAQVISGVGFLGAGMIILKNNNIFTYYAKNIPTKKCCIRKSLWGYIIIFLSVCQISISGLKVTPLKSSASNTYFSL